MRPKLWHHIMTGLSVSLLLAVTLFVCIRYKSLPDQIPTHFGADGAADGFGSRSSILFPLILAWFTLGLMTVLSFFPNAWNVPSNKPRTLAAAADMIAVLRLVVSAMFAWMILCSTLGRGLGVWFLPVTMLATFAPLVYLLVVAAKK